MPASPSAIVELPHDGQSKSRLMRLNLCIPRISAKRMGFSIRIDLCPLSFGGRLWV